MKWYHDPNSWTAFARMLGVILGVVLAASDIVK
jgi:hypothetical protein